MSPLATDILLERFDAVACPNCSQQLDVSDRDPFTPVRCPACGTEFQVPARFANFLLIDQLGKGGMGAVYKAYDETLGRTVALKVMQQSIGQDRSFVDQFLQEARALAAINHPNIVQIYSYGEENGQPYIVMELVDGDRLDRIHSKQKVLDEEFVLKMALQVIGGLQAANAAGMTHGDIKPANILFDRAGNAKVADFGLARLNGQKPKPGEIWGTPYYVAPEVVRGQAPNAGSDIYSLGGTLYHILTGEPPFNGETVTDTVLLRFKEPAPDPREFKPTLSARTSQILLRMLEMDPFARYPTFASLAKDVEGALVDLKESKAPKKKKPSVLVPVLIALVAIAAIGAGTWIGMNAAAEKRAEREKKEQFERDLAEGRLVQRYIHGKMTYVRVNPGNAGDGPSSAASGGGDAAASAAPVQTHWELAAVGDTDILGSDEVSEFRDRSVLTLRAGTGELEKATKIYLRFSLEGIDKARLGDAAIRLTAGRKGQAKSRDNSYKIHVWALNEPRAWDDDVRWSAAPGNIAGDACRLDPDQATLLAVFGRIPANPEPGTKVEIPLERDKFAKFIRAYPSDDLTLVVTADTATDQRGGWRFTAREDSGHAPPTLVLDARRK